VDGIGGLLQSLADAIVGLFGNAVRAFGAAVQGIVGVFESILPGLWLPAVVIVVVLIVGWNLAKR
jgi:hypothetical protein